MPIVTDTLAHDGALVTVRIGLSRPEVRRLRQLGRPIPAEVEVRALVDIGAECTCADPQAVAALPLNFHGAGLANLPASSGLQGAAQYDCALTVLDPSGTGSSLTIPEIPLTLLPIGPLGYQALLGRDVLARCLLVYDGPAQRFTLAF